MVLVIQSKHLGIRYPCDQCEYVAPVEESLKTHKNQAESYMPLISVLIRFHFDADPRIRFVEKLIWILIRPQIEKNVNFFSFDTIKNVVSYFMNR